MPEYYYNGDNWYHICHTCRKLTTSVNTESQGNTTMIRPSVNLANLRKTCESHPAQWEAVDDTGKHVYIRYRFGVLTVGVDEVHNKAVLGKFDTHLFLRLKLGSPYHGEMTTEEMIKNTTIIIDWH